MKDASTDQDIAASALPAPAANPAPKQRGRPFPKGVSGNPKGRAKGSRTLTASRIDAMMEAEAEAVTKAALERAKRGDPASLKLVLDRIAPPRRGRPVRFTLPGLLKTAADVADALSLIAAAMAAGELSPEEAAAAAAVLETKRRAIETAELETRVAQLETATGAVTQERG